MLSELGRNVPISNADTWDKNEVVYYFNEEPKITSAPADTWDKNEVVYYFNEEPKITSAPEEKKNSIYKYLSVVLFNDKVKHTNNGERGEIFFFHSQKRKLS